MTKEKSFVLIKPDGVQRGLVGEVIKRIERTGLKMIAMKMFVADEERLWKHYNKDDKWFQEKGEIVVKNRSENGLSVEKEALEYGKDILRANIAFMTSGPVVAMVWQGNKAVGIIKKLVGGTEPLTSDVGTIRGDFTVDSYELANADGRAVRNLVHCSDVVDEAKREIDLWWSADEIVNYRLIQDQILYDVNLDGILE
jgi:nucleoside-diphosphate kinase